MRESILLLLLAFSAAVCLSLAQNDSSPIAPPINAPKSPESLLMIADVSTRECVKKGKSRCSCIDLWQSDCVCDGSDDYSYSSGKRKCGNCSEICEEVWSRKSIDDQRDFSCHVPIISQYYVQFFTRSMSQWGSEAIQSFKLVLEYLGDSIAFDVFYVGQYSQNSFASAGGPAEVTGDIFQLCAMQHYPHYSRYMPFLYCMARTRQSIPSNVPNCSKAHLMDLELLKDCYSNGEGLKLLGASMKMSAEYRVSEPLPVVVMDGRPFRTASSRSAENFLYALCYIFENPSRPFPWWVFGFMGCAVLALLLVLFIVKQWDSDSIGEVLRSLFLFDATNGHEAGHEFYDEEFFRMLEGHQQEEAEANAAEPAQASNEEADEDANDDPDEDSPSVDIDSAEEDDSGDDDDAGEEQPLTDRRRQRQQD